MIAGSILTLLGGASVYQGTVVEAMHQSQNTILIASNYFEWKEWMDILLRSKGLYRVTMETKYEPNVEVEKSKCHNRRGEAYGLLCLSISRDLLFHLDGLTSQNEVWEKLQTYLER